MKLIPGTQGFMASEDGVIYDPSGNIRTTYNNADGYFTCSVKLIDGRWVTFGIQRLVALAYLRCPGDPSNYVVNHIDLDISNNDANNLEWVTVEQNNIHAALFGLNCDRIQLRADSVDPVSFLFSNNIKEMAKLTLTSEFDIWKSIKDNVAIDRWTFKYIRSGEKPKETHKRRLGGSYLRGRKIWIKDIDTGVVEVYNSLTEAAQAHQTTSGHICFAICKPNRLRLFKSNYLVSDTCSFPEITPEQIEIRRASWGRSIIAYNVDIKTLYTSSSASSFVKLYKLSKKAITTTLKKNLIALKSGWLFLYDTPENRVRLFAEIKRLTGSVPD